MRVAGAAMLAGMLCAVGSARAQDARRISLRDLVSNARAYTEQAVRLPALSCVDDPKAGFVCVAPVGGQVLRLEASVLGARTSQAVAERLIGDCKGTANLLRAECRVEVAITPRASRREVVETERGSQPVVIVYSGEIDMFVVSRR